MKKILFLCTGNSCRSQMAEGWCNHLFPKKIRGYSAGVQAQGLNPNAVAVMREAGIDISSQSSELLEVYLDHEIDLVVTVCDNAAENCPVFTGAAKTIHHPFDDPPALASNESNEARKLDHYRRVRDEIRYVVQRLGEEIISNQ